MKIYDLFRIFNSETRGMQKTAHLSPGARQRGEFLSVSEKKMVNSPINFISNSPANHVEIRQNSLQMIRSPVLRVWCRLGKIR